MKNNHKGKVYVYIISLISSWKQTRKLNNLLPKHSEKKALQVLNIFKELEYIYSGKIIRFD